MEHLKYPIGRFELTTDYSSEKVEEYIRTLEKFTPLFAQIALELTSEQLHKSYRQGGWNAIQLIHHVVEIEKVEVHPKVSFDSCFENIFLHAHITKCWKD